MPCRDEDVPLTQPDPAAMSTLMFAPAPRCVTIRSVPPTTPDWIGASRNTSRSSFALYCFVWRNRGNSTAISYSSVRGSPPLSALVQRRRLACQYPDYTPRIEALGSRPFDDSGRCTTL